MTEGARLPHAACELCWTSRPCQTLRPRLHWRQRQGQRSLQPLLSCDLPAGSLMQGSDGGGGKGNIAMYRKVLPTSSPSMRSEVALPRLARFLSSQHSEGRGFPPGGERLARSRSSHGLGTSSGDEMNGGLQKNFSDQAFQLFPDVEMGQQSPFKLFPGVGVSGELCAGGWGWRAVCKLPVGPAETDPV